jgi:osmotically-inducible protein OsmY
MSKTKDIRDAVAAELLFDPLIDDANISVQSSGGDVTLDGTVTSYSQYLEAASAAQRVAGVKSVTDNLTVVPPATDFRDDASLSAAASNALLWAVNVPPDVTAIVTDGIVTLTGTVSFGSERSAAEVAVGGLIGLRGIDDQIVISYDADPGDVTVAVQDALDRNALVDDDSDIVVNTDGSTVTLSGEVDTWAEHDAVVEAAWMASGVYDVIDNLVIAD